MSEEAPIPQGGLEEQFLLFTHAYSDAYAENQNEGRKQREPESDSDPHGRTLRLCARNSKATTARRVKKSRRITNPVG
jgi:hypothetical protein